MTLAGFVADFTSGVVNIGPLGIRHINVEATLHLVRIPDGDEIGLASTFVVPGDGISGGSAVLFDHEGPLGVSGVSAIGHAAPALESDAV